jgi:predicted signal transduction protein with EAL and GGDEF domain
VSDTASRLGGDEFAVLIEDTANTEGGILVAERIGEVLRAPFLLEGKQVFVGVSIGIATRSASNETPEEILRNADVAMYMAKSEGKNQYAVFENAMHDAVLRRAELETELRAGIDKSEFEMVYQPIVDLASGNVIAMEALIRWNHPRKIGIGPEEFIRIAEEISLMPRLGQWILNEACTQAAKWQTEFGPVKPLDMTVNISSRQFIDDGLVEAVRSALDLSGLNPNNLILEITEGTMLRNTEATINKLKELRLIGVRLAIDDFGTGYSSLSYLHKFPIDVLKIDRSFIQKINEGHEGAAMARAIISMSETLHLETIAEGIETPDQIATLKELGCEMGQGYLFAKPLGKNDMHDFLRDVRLAGGDGSKPFGYSQTMPEGLAV